MTNPWNVRASVLLVGLLLAGTAVVATAAPPSPMPGGANQTSGVSGKLSSVLFNGTLRLRSMSLKDAGPTEAVRPAAGERGLVFRAIVSNGTSHENHGFFDASLADANGITIAGRPLDDGWSLQPGMAGKTAIGFNIPADFVPTRLVLIEAAAPKKVAFRITIGPNDLPTTGMASPRP